MNPEAEQKIHLVVGSRFENIELAQYILDEVLREAHWGEEERHWMALALREAMANAIKHGNRLDPTKSVDVTIEVRNGILELAVEDRGDGFDPTEVPDPLAPENLLKAEGRGIFYMRRFMDEVGYSVGSEGGTRVRMVKQFAPVKEREEKLSERKEMA
jgi:serine/threonine-protein kinase RsbW